MANDKQTPVAHTKPSQDAPPRPGEDKRPKSKPEPAKPFRFSDWASI